MPEFTTNDGVRLSYLDEGDGRPVILINGYAAPATSWALTTDALVAAGFRVIAWDRRSHGDSETTMWGQRMSRHGRDLGELIDHLALDRATLVGASMGGNTIWAYVDQFGTGRLDGIVIVDQTPKMLNSDEWPHGFYGYDAANAATLFADGAPQTGKGRDPQKSMPGIMRLIERLGTPPTIADAKGPALLGLLQDHALADWRDLVVRAECAVLMVAARESQMWPCEHAAAAVAGNPRGRSVIVEDSGHAINIDQPDRLNELLLEFLG